MSLGNVACQADYVFQDVCPSCIYKLHILVAITSFVIKQHCAKRQVATFGNSNQNRQRMLVRE